MPVLRSGDLSLVVAPEHGGGLAEWSWRQTPLFRPVRGLGCFPLLPYANRIGHGRFTWDGLDRQLPLNFGDHPHSIHGIGWQRAWSVAAASGAEAVLTLEHDGTADWPFAFSAEQRFVLEPRSLRIEVRLTNRHAAAAPAGIGLHPFFPRPAGASLRFRAGSVWLNDPTARPVRQVPVPAAWDHSAGLAVGTQALDQCFAGWDGLAQLDLGAVRLRIEASPTFRHLQVYTPPGEAFFCVEPVSHRPDAINDPNRTGMAILALGQTLAGTVAIHMTQPSSG